MIKWLKFAWWFFNVFRPLDEQDRSSLKEAIRRLSNYKKEKTYCQTKPTKNWVDIKLLHDTIMPMVPSGAGYILLVSALQVPGADWKPRKGADKAEIFFSSNLSNERGQRLLEIMIRDLRGKIKLQAPTLPPCDELDIPPCDELDIDPTSQL